MNKKILIVVAVLLLIGVGYLLYMKVKSPAGQLSTLTGTSQGQKPGSLKDLLTLGTAQTCTFNNQGSAGKVYVSGGKVRGDFDTTTESTTTKSHMIIDGNTSYIWMDGQTTGFKMSFNPDQTPSATASTQTSTGSFDPRADMNYECSAWVVDSSMFALPSGVTFQEFNIPSSAPAAKSGSGAADNSAQCGYCNSLSGDDKTQCLTALKCN